MSKEELKQLVKHTFAWELVGESGSVEEGEEELLNAMVAAYNKGVEDSKNVIMKQSYYAPKSEIRDAVGELKIRD